MNRHLRHWIGHRKAAGHEIRQNKQISRLSKRFSKYLLGIELTELLQILERDVIASNVEHNVLKSTTMAVGENETITVDELGVLGVVGHELVEQDMGHGSTAHGSTCAKQIPFRCHNDLLLVGFHTYQDDQSWHP